MTVLQNNINQASGAQISHVQLSNLQRPKWKLPIWHVSQWLDNYFIKTKRQAVVRSALIAVAERHSSWAEVGFDDHFVNNQGAAALDAYFCTGQLPNTAALVEAWSGQYPWASITKQEAQKRFTPIAEDFVYILSTASI